MKISVITPTFNSEKTIAKNVESILNQSYKDFEHIIIDNQSNDKTLEIIRNLYTDLPANLSIISEKDSGIAEAFNKGIISSTGSVIAILNSDDFYFSDNIFEQVVNGFKQSQFLVFHGDVLFIDSKYGSYKRKPYNIDTFKTMPLNHPTMFIKKEVYTLAGLFDTSYRYSMDFEFYCRLYNLYPDLSNKLYYFDKNPVVVMSAGGQSWANEIQSILEVKRAVKKNGLTSFSLIVQLQLRLIRTYLKNILNKIGFTFLIRFWRKILH
jgi:glycosyltransferase involved in cell wall biosynthesis